MPHNVKLVVAAVSLLLGTLLGVVLTPTELATYADANLKLEDAIPSEFGAWQALDDSNFVLPADEDSLQNNIYDQILTRRYVSDAGDVMMLLIAYGQNQSDALQLHRPEICYRAAGFIVTGQEEVSLALATATGNVDLPAVRVATKRRSRIEPVTYWTRVGSEIPNNVVDLQIGKLVTGLKGRIPDGVLVRVSSLGKADSATFSRQESFIAELLATLEPDALEMLIGARHQAYAQRAAPTDFINSDTPAVAATGL